LSDGKHFRVWLSLKAGLYLAGSSADRQFTAIRTGFALTGRDGAQVTVHSSFHRGFIVGSYDADRIAAAV
jgi:hypothetical protein